MWSNAALNWIVVSDVSSRLWVVGSNCWCWCFALSNMALQLFDLVDRLNMMPRKTGLVPSYRWGKSLEMFFFLFFLHSYRCPWHTWMAVQFCLAENESQKMQSYGWSRHLCSFMAVLKPALKYGQIYSELQRGVRKYWVSCYFLWFSSVAIKITIFGVARQQLILSCDKMPGQQTYGWNLMGNYCALHCACLSAY